MNAIMRTKIQRVALTTVLRLGSMLLATGAPAMLSASNIAPVPVVLSAVQRPGTTFMDIDYRVNDPDDAVVQTAALGFVNGGTNLADVIKVTTLVEGTAANIGSNTPANTTLRLTWNVAADWNTNFGNVQIEILAKDSRGLLPFHWITLPSNGPNPEITINDRPVYDADLLPIWYWLIATGDPAIQLMNGQVLAGGIGYNSTMVAKETFTTWHGRKFIGERLNMHSLSGDERARADAGRYGFASVDTYSFAKNLAVNPDRVYGWGNNDSGQLNLAPATSITAIALGLQHTLVLAGGRIAGWGSYSQTTIPERATNVVAIAAGNLHSLALRAGGTLVCWGDNRIGQTNIPVSATNVVAIAAGAWHNLALTSDGRILGWGENSSGQTTIPSGLTNVVAISAGAAHSLALTAEGRVLGWGYNVDGETVIPSGLSNVVAIAAGGYHNVALKADGSIVTWGLIAPAVTIPTDATNVTAIAAGTHHSLALKADGTVLVWGNNGDGIPNVPMGLSGVDLLGIGCMAQHIVVVDKHIP